MKTQNVVEMRPSEQTSFDEFWKNYPPPRRVKKALARAKWDAITGDGLKTKTFDKDSNSYVDIELRATPAELVEGAKRYDEAMKDPRPFHYGYRDDGKFISHPATWLNQGRWMDTE